MKMIAKGRFCLSSFRILFSVLVVGLSLPYPYDQTVAGLADESALEDLRVISDKYIFAQHPNYTERNSIISEYLQQNIAFDVYQSIFQPFEVIGRQSEQDSAAGNLEFSQTMVDFEGKSYSCKAGDPGSISNSDPAASNPSDDPFYALEGQCVELEMGWWTYRWCHRDRITQYHVDAQTGAVAPSWSLGVWDRTEVAGEEQEGEGGEEEGKGEGAPPPPRPRAVVDRFEGGQWCDETRAPRRAKAVYRCCNAPRPARTSGGRHRRPSGNTGAATPAAQRGGGVSFTIREEALCSYELQVCGPSFCDEEEDGAAAAGGGGGGAATAERLLRKLRGTCVHKNEGWWTYEFCFMQSIRQYHVQVLETHTADDHSESKKTRIQSEFKLGHFNQKTKIKDEESIKNNPGQTGVPGYLEVEYQGGSSCQLTEKPRSTTVQFRCGVEDKIVSIVEDQTCHYVAIVSTPVLCSHPLLGVKEEPSMTMYCSEQSQ